MRRHGAGGDPDESQARGRQRLGLSRIGALPIRPLVCGIVEFNHGDHGEIALAEYKVGHQPKELILDGLSIGRVRSEFDELRQSDLRENDMMRKYRYQSLIQLLLTLSQERARAQRPPIGTGTIA
jgi:hypothetical protein